MGFALVIGLIGIVSALAIAWGTKENDSKLRKNKTKTSFRDVLKVFVKNDQLMCISLTYVFYTTGISIVNALELYYFIYIVGDSTKFSLLASLNAVIGVFSVLTFPSLAQKFNSRKVILFAITLMLLGMSIFACAGKSLLLILLGAVCFYIPQPFVFLVVLMIITDSVEYGQLKFGHRDESLILSVRPLLDKFGGAVSNGLVGLTAIWAGMTSGVSAKVLPPRAKYLQINDVFTTSSLNLHRLSHFY